MQSLSNAFSWIPKGLRRRRRLVRETTHLLPPVLPTTMATIEKDVLSFGYFCLFNADGKVSEYHTPKENNYQVSDAEEECVCNTEMSTLSKLSGSFGVTVPCYEATTKCKHRHFSPSSVLDLSNYFSAISLLSEKFKDDFDIDFSSSLSVCTPTYLNLPLFMDPNLGLIRPLPSLTSFNKVNIIQKWKMTPKFQDYLPSALYLLSEKEASILLLGGIDPMNPTDYLSGGSIFKYCCGKQIWQFHGTMPEPRSYHAASLVGINLYVTGGYSPFERRCGEIISTPTVFSLNLKSQIWKRCADMNQARACHAMVTFEDKLYVFGGRDKTGRILSSVEKYDPARDIWIEISPLPEPRMGLTASCYMGTIWIIGGLTNIISMKAIKNCILASVCNLDPTSGRWTSQQPLSEPRAFCSSISMGGNIWLFGGTVLQRDKTKWKLFSTSLIDIFSPSLLKWQHQTCLASPKHAFSLAAVGSKVYIIGGIKSSESMACNDVDMLNTINGYMTEEAVLPVFAAGCTAVHLSQNKSQFYVNTDIESDQLRKIPSAASSKTSNLYERTKSEMSCVVKSYSRTPSQFEITHAKQSFSKTYMTTFNSDSESVQKPSLHPELKLSVSKMPHLILTTPSHSAINMRRIGAIKEVEIPGSRFHSSSQVSLRQKNFEMETTTSKTSKLYLKNGQYEKNKYISRPKKSSFSSIKLDAIPSSSISSIKKSFSNTDFKDNKSKKPFTLINGNMPAYYPRSTEQLLDIHTEKIDRKNSVSGALHVKQLSKTSLKQVELQEEIPDMGLKFNAIPSSSISNIKRSFSKINLKDNKSEKSFTLINQNKPKYYQRSAEQFLDAHAEKTDRKRSISGALHIKQLSKTNSKLVELQEELPEIGHTYSTSCITEADTKSSADLALKSYSVTSLHSVASTKCNIVNSKQRSGSRLHLQKMPSSRRLNTSHSRQLLHHQKSAEIVQNIGERNIFQDEKNKEMSNSYKRSQMNNATESRILLNPRAEEQLVSHHIHSTTSVTYNFEPNEDNNSILRRNEPLIKKQEFQVLRTVSVFDQINQNDDSLFDSTTLHEASAHWLNSSTLSKIARKSEKNILKNMKYTGLFKSNLAAEKKRAVFKRKTPLDVDPNLGIVSATLSKINSYCKESKDKSISDRIPSFASSLPLPTFLQELTLPAILTLGGLNPHDPTNDAIGKTVLRFHPLKNHWEFAGFMPVSRNYHGAAFLNHCIYIIGGYDSQRIVNGEMIATCSVWTFDLLERRWQRRCDMHCARASHGIVVFEECIFVFGGRNSSGRIISSVEKYDEKEDKWIQCCSMPHPIMGAAVTVVEDCVCIIGGITEINQYEPVLSNFLLYEPYLNSWSYGPSLNFPIAYAGATCCTDTVALYGGFRPGGKSVYSIPNVYTLDVSVRKWREICRLSTSRHSAVTVSVGSCTYVIGGMSTIEQDATNKHDLVVTDEQYCLPLAPLPTPMTGMAGVILPPKVKNVYRTASVESIFKKFWPQSEEDKESD